MTNYVMNRLGYFFFIEGLEIDKEKFEGCTFFDTSYELFSAVIEKHELESIEEVDGNEMVIKHNSNGEIMMYDFRGCGSYLEDSVSKTISEFVM